MAWPWAENAMKRPNRGSMILEYHENPPSNGGFSWYLDA
jgi:hypothetical protein